MLQGIVFNSFKMSLGCVPGAVFTKGLSQVLGLSWLYFCTKLKPNTWLRPFVNTAPDVQDRFLIYNTIASENLPIVLAPSDWITMDLI